ncbi:MAG: hypothetical protein Q8M92_03405 [Candidatus Subteraquimicrobiales bacterium]|nr:hypothetical protein [Candidatus Subteraquimicrobiales bacterium]
MERKKFDEDVRAKGFFTALGMWLLLHEVADDIIRATIKRGRSISEDKRDFLDELVVTVDDEKGELREKLTEVVQAALEKHPYTLQSEIIQSLTTRIDELEEKIRKLEAKPSKK